jgi:2-methylcitrate dehydratase
MRPGNAAPHTAAGKAPSTRRPAIDHVLELLSGHAVSLSLQQLPAAVVHQTRRLVIDTLGCAIGSYHMQPPAIARGHALESVCPQGSTILGTRHRTAPELAAFANGVMARYLDFNDTSSAAQGGHPSDNIMAVLAAAEYAGANMQDTLAGIVVAYETHNRLAEACNVRVNGWDNAVYVVIASAAGAGRAMKLDRTQMANALALAVVPNASMNQTRVGALSMWKGCAAGNAGRNGVFAALLARRGLTGPAQAFEGPLGFGKQLGTSLRLPAFGGNGVPFAVETAQFKSFPCDHEAQCAVTPALQLHHALQGKVDQIEQVDIETYAFALKIAADGSDKWHPVNRETADHSIPYVVAVALSTGKVWIDDFDEARIRNPDLHALMRKIRVRASEECTSQWPLALPFRITVTTRSGENHVREVRYAKGHPRNPMTDAEIEAKFLKLATPVMGQTAAERALGALWGLEQIGNARKILALFALD